MNPLTALALLFGGYYLYTAQKAKEDAAAKAVDDQASTNPMVADVYALKAAINPSTFNVLVKFDDADTETIHSILRKYAGNKFNAFNQMFKDKYQAGAMDLINQKLILTQENKDWVLSIIQGKETIQQQAGDFPNIKPDIIPVKDNGTGWHVKFKVAKPIYNSINADIDYRKQQPDTEHPGQMQAAGTVSDYTTTGVEYTKTNYFSSNLVFALLGNDDRTDFYWVLVADNKGSFISYV
jgi:hypothetical protein